MTRPQKIPLKKKADMIKYTKDKVKMSAYLDEWEKTSSRQEAALMALLSGGVAAMSVPLNLHLLRSRRLRKKKTKKASYLGKWEKISKKRKGPSTLDTVKSVAPLAAAGLATGLGKGFVEEGITRRVASSMKKRKNPWISRRAHEIGRGAGKGLTGAIATVLLGLATQKMIKSQSKTRKR